MHPYESVFQEGFLESETDFLTNQRCTIPGQGTFGKTRVLSKRMDVPQTALERRSLVNGRAATHGIARIDNGGAGLRHPGISGQDPRCERSSILLLSGNRQ